MARGSRGGGRPQGGFYLEEGSVEPFLVAGPGVLPSGLGFPRRHRPRSPPWHPWVRPAELATTRHVTGRFLPAVINQVLLVYLGECLLTPGGSIVSIRNRQGEAGRVPSQFSGTDGRTLTGKQRDLAADERDEAGAERDHASEEFETSVSSSQRCARCGRLALLPGCDEFLPGTVVPPEVMCEYCVTPLVFDVIVDDLQARVREHGLQRRASQGGLALMKSQRRDPGARGFGSYILVDSQVRMIVASGLPEEYGLDLAGVERYLENHERHHVAGFLSEIQRDGAPPGPL
jgi:hypothetical protein